MPKYLKALLKLVVLVLVVKILFTQNLFRKVEDGFVYLSGSIEKQGMHALARSLEEALPDLSEDQTFYIEGVIANKNTIRRFYIAYCKGDDKNPIIYGRQLATVCEQIDKSLVLSS